MSAFFDSFLMLMPLVVATSFTFSRIMMPTFICGGSIVAVLIT
jgi:hypothetical protein